MERTTNRKMASPMMISIKVTLISTGIVAMYLFVKSCVPIVVDFSLSRFPILRSSFLSWLKPPYLFVIINVIIVTTIVASSRYFKCIDDPVGEVKDVDMDGYFVAMFPPPIVFITDVDRSDVVCEEKEEKDISGLNNCGDEFVLLTRKLNQMPSMMEASETEKPLVSAISSHRKPVKVTPKGRNRRKESRVVKPKWHETTMENTSKMMETEEVKSTPLTNYCRRPETFGLGAGESQPALRKSETFRDMTNNYRKSPTVTPLVKMKKEMSPSREELNRKCEAFIKKGKEEMLESLRLDKEVEGRPISF